MRPIDSLIRMRTLLRIGAISVRADGGSKRGPLLTLPPFLRHPEARRGWHCGSEALFTAVIVAAMGTYVAYRVPLRRYANLVQGHSASLG